MLILRSVKQKLTIVGIYFGDEKSFNFKNTIILVMFLITLIMFTAFLVFGAKTLSEFGNALYISTTALVVPSFFFIFITKAKLSDKTIKKIEITIDSRECIFKMKYFIISFHENCI